MSNTGTYTGKYPHGDSGSIENAPIDQIKKLNAFKGAKTIDTEFLKKKNKVRMETDEPYKGKGA